MHENIVTSTLYQTHGMPLCNKRTLCSLQLLNSLFLKYIINSHVGQFIIHWQFSMLVSNKSQVCISKTSKSAYRPWKPQAMPGAICVCVCDFNLLFLSGRPHWLLFDWQQMTGINSLRFALYGSAHRTCKLINKLADLDGADSKQTHHTKTKMKKPKKKTNSSTALTHPKIGCG